VRRANMELHVWAKFDSGGKLQSVQSSFSQTPDTPTPPASLGQGAWSPGSESGSRFVPYEEKKALDTKLGHKVDEMGLLVLQTAELAKRNKLQDK